MTKEIYLNQLKSELRGLPYDDITDILAEIGSHFDEGITNGQTSDEIAKRLGSPKRLAFQYFIDTPKAKESGWISSKPLSMLIKFAGLCLAGITAFPLAIAVLAIVFSLYLVIFCGYFVGFIFIISPLIEIASPEHFNSGGISPWVLSTIGVIVLIGSHYVFKIFNRIVTSIYRYAIKRPIIRNR